MFIQSLVALYRETKLFRVATLASAGIVLLQVGCSMARTFGWMPAVAFSDALAIVSSSITCAGLAYAARHSARLGRPAQRGWQMLALAYLCYAGGAVTWFVLDVIMHQAGIPSLADAFYLLALVCAIIGILQLSAWAEPPRESMRVFLDVGVVMLSVALAFWVLVMEPALASQDDADIWARSFVLLYLLLELAVFFAFLYLLFGHWRAGSTLVLYLIIGGLFLQIVSEAGFTVLALHAAYASGIWIDAGYLLANGLVLLAGVAQGITARQGAVIPLQPEAGRRPRWMRYIPYAGVLLAYGLLILQETNLFLISFPTIAFIVGVIIALILLRQIITLNENQRLYAAAQKEIAERQAVEQSLRRLEKALETMNLGVTITDPQGIIIYTNPADAQMHGYTVAELIGKPARIFSPDPRLDGAAQTMLKHWHTWQREQMNVRKDGTLFPVQLTSNVVLDARGEVIGIVTTCQDITERKQTERALEHAQAELEMRVHERTLELQSANLRLEHLLTNSPTVIYSASTETNFKINFISSNVELLFGYPAQHYLQEKNFWFSHIHPDDQPRVLGELANLEHKHVIVTDYRFRHRNGTWHWTRDLIQVVRDSVGKPLEIVGAWIDISESKRAEERQRILYETLRMISARLDLAGVVQIAADTIARLADYPHVCIALLNETGEQWTVRGAAGKLAATIGATYSIEQGVIGRCLRTRQVQWVRDVLNDTNYVRDVHDTGAPALRSEITVPLQYSGRLLGALNIESEQPDAFDGNDAIMIEALGEMIALAVEHARLYEQVQMLAVTDELTGIYNRRGFFDLAGREFERAKRFGRPLALVMFDIDYFKHVNDQYTHAAGDLVLRALAQRAERNARHFDILGRYGGEEFVWLLPETDLTTAREAAERLRQSIQDLRVVLTPNQPPVGVTISLGVAEFTPDIPNLAEMIHRADQALLRAKNAGRNRVESAIGK